MKKKLYYILLIFLLVSCDNSLSKNEKENIPFIDEGIKSEKYEIISLTSQEYKKLSYALPYNEIPKEKLSNKTEEEKWKIEKEYANNFLIGYADNNTIAYSVRENNNKFIIKYNLISSIVDTLETEGRIYKNGDIIDIYSSSCYSWFMTGDKTGYPLIEYRESSPLPKGISYYSLLDDLYNRAEFTDYSNTEFRYYISPNWYLVTNRNWNSNFSLNKFKKKYPEKGKQTIINFYYPKAKKYYKVLDKDIANVFAKDDDNNSYDDYIPSTYSEIKMPKEKLRFKFKGEEPIFFGNKELYKKGILLMYFDFKYSYYYKIEHKGGLYLIRPKEKK